MMKHEFEQIAGYEVSFEDYNNIIEPMYTATNLSKQDFVRCIDRRRFALPTKGETKKKMRKIAHGIFNGCGLRAYIEDENELVRLAHEYARRFHGIDPEHDSKAYVLITRDYACCGVRQDRGCTFPDEIIIGRDGVGEYERIILVA